jgi:hypothetical protein
MSVLQVGRTCYLPFAVQGLPKWKTVAGATALRQGGLSPLDFRSV